MDKAQVVEVIQKRLCLDNDGFMNIQANPKFQRLFENAIKASQYQLVAEVIESKGCHSGHRTENHF